MVGTRENPLVFLVVLDSNNGSSRFVFEYTKCQIFALKCVYKCRRKWCDAKVAVVAHYRY